MRVRGTRIVSGQVRCARHWEGEPREETRQEYATYHVQRFLKFATGPLHFSVLLEFYRSLGELYDRGHRLSDLEGAA